jgi:hypothetical protein
MNILAIIGAAIQIITMWLKTKIESDEALRKKKEKLLSEATDAIKDKDTSAVTTAFDRLNRL